MEASGEVPRELRRYRVEEWFREGDDVMFDPHKRWREARLSWAREHGYDVEAHAGAAPGKDWWAFVQACREGE